MEYNKMCINFYVLRKNLLNDTRSGDEGDVFCTADNVLIIANN